MKYLRLDGTVTNEEGEVLLDVVKLNLAIPAGAVFCNTKYGYTNLDVSDVDSVRENINKTISRFGLNQLMLENIRKTSSGTMTVSFTGDNQTIQLSTGEE